MAANFDSKFEKLIKGQVKYQSSNLGLNLLISRLQKKYAGNQTPAELKSCLNEMQTFFNKYSAVVQKDLDAIAKL